MSNQELSPATRKRDMPEYLTGDQVANLQDDAFYPSFFYNVMFDLKQSNAVLKDYERGIIDPRQVITLGPYKPMMKRKVGQKVRLRISGRELKRLWQDGRQVGFYKKVLERLAV